MAIKLDPPKGDSKWRAVVHVGADLSDGQGVRGQATGEGPWMEAIGATPAEATSRLLEAVGLAYVTRSGAQ